MSLSEKKTISSKSKEQTQGVATPPAFLYLILFGMGIFLFTLIFFAKIHPLVPYDMDDWLYVGWRRNAYPIWKDWNPARVFPETFMSLVSDLGVHVLMPLLHLDYIHALILAHALSVAGFITVYVMLFRYFLAKRGGLAKLPSCMLTLLFFLFHFSILRRQYQGNQHLFWTFNLTGYYYYVIPNLMNASLVMFFLAKGRDGIRSLPVFQKGILLLAIYLAMFSNLFSSIILAGFVGGEVIWEAYRCLIRRNQSVIQFLGKELWQLLILLLWLVSLVYEANGGRAEGAGTFALQESIAGFLAWGRSLNLQTVALSGTILIAGLVLCLHTWKKKRSFSEIVPIIPAFAFCTILCAIYEILLCAKVGTDKLEICRVIFSVFFYAFLMIFAFAAEILQRMPRTLVLLPLILYVLLMNTRMGERIFLEENGIDLDAQLCIAIDQDIIDQVIAADRAGRTEATIRVPLEEEEENWPHVIRMGSALSQTLYKHGIVSRRIDLDILPDHGMNEQYGLPY